MASARPTHAATLAALYATVPDHRAWPNALAVIADHVGATGGMLVYHALKEPRTFMVTQRLREDLDALYASQYAVNPFSLAARHAPVETPLIASRMADMSAVRRTAFHADILATQRIEEMVLVVNPSLTRAGSSGGISVSLDRRQAEDTDQVVARLGALAPHLSRVVDLSMQIGRALEASRQVAQLLEVLPGAALLIDARCRLTIANAAAEAILSAADGLAANGAEGLQLSAELAVEQRGLAQMLGRAVGIASGEERALRAAIRVSRPSGRPPYIVVATPLPPPAFGLWNAVEPGARALVQIVDPESALNAQAETLREAAGLTPTEARVAGLIAAGRTTPEVARLLGVSSATVRTHLARCFDKTGLHSQVGLARLLGALSK